MWKLLLFCSLFSIAFAGVIRDEEPIEAETDLHHNVDHQHAQSHQSLKIHHFHAVPVYVKDTHLLKHPIEVGGLKHKLKVLHPKTEHSHGHGLTLENHTEEKDLHLHGYESYGGSESNLQYRTSEDQGEGAHDVSQHQFQDINVHHGHGEQ